MYELPLAVFVLLRSRYERVDGAWNLGTTWDQHCHSLTSKSFLRIFVFEKYLKYPPVHYELVEGQSSDLG